MFEPRKSGCRWLVACLLLGLPWAARLAHAGQSIRDNPLRTVSNWSEPEVVEQLDLLDDIPAPEPPAELCSDEGLRSLDSPPPFTSPQPLAPCRESECGEGGGWYTAGVWAQFDALLWWSQGQHTPALVTTSPDGTLREDAGVLGRPGTRILHGGQRLDGNGRWGGRFNIGMWIDPCRCSAIEATWFVVGDGGNSGNFYARSVQDPVSPILARPFFNTQLDQPDAELIAFPNVVIGDVQVETSNELHSVSILARRNYCRGPGGSFNLVGGYRYLRFREGLLISEQLTSIDDGGVVAVGTEFDLDDSFATDNEFHGGELGLSLFYDCGPWTLDILTKVAIGNMRQTVVIDGSTTTISPIDPPLVRDGGLLALPTNIGHSQRDELALIPELNLNLRYYWNPCFSTTIGYSLLWITDVARAGDQIDLRINPSQLPSGGGTIIGDAFPQRRLRDTSMWYQGLNVGFAWQY